MNGLCSDETIAAVIDLLQSDELAGINRLRIEVAHYPDDARLHFLYGSLLAGAQHYEEGRKHMRQAVTLDPDFDLARFQLGFLELSSGLASEAATTWQPLEERPASHPFRVLASGLVYLAEDKFDEARKLLKTGIELNTDHPLINADMQLILDEIRDRPPHAVMEADASLPGAEEEMSAAQMLLSQSRIKSDSPKKKLH